MHEFVQIDFKKLLKTSSKVRFFSFFKYELSISIVFNFRIELPYFLSHFPFFIILSPFLFSLTFSEFEIYFKLKFNVRVEKR